MPLAGGWHKLILAAAALALPASGVAFARSAAAVLPTGGVTTSSSSWAATIPPRPTSVPRVTDEEVDAVSCPSPGECVAVGRYESTSGVLEPLVLEESADTWSTVVRGMPTGAAAADRLTLQSLSCADFGDCVATGTYLDASGYGQGLLLVESAGSWTAIEAPTPNGSLFDPGTVPDAVSCPAVGACVAVGTYDDAAGVREALVLQQSPAGWTATGIGAPTTAAGSKVIDVVSLSCPAVGDCEAGGQYWGGSYGGMTLEETDGSWQATASPFWSVGAIDCPAVDSCAMLAASQTSGFLTMTSNGAQSQIAGGFFALSCVSPDSCVAVGSTPDAATGSTDPFVVTDDQGSFTPFSPPLPSGAPVPAANTPARLVTVGCQSDGTCTALGTYHDAKGRTEDEVVSGSGTNWSATELPLPVGATLASPDGADVSCDPGNTCVAFGSILNSYDEQEGLLASGGGTSWAAIKVPAPPSSGVSPINSMTAVTCGTTCVAFGTIGEPDGDATTAIVETGTPGGTWQPSFVRLRLPAGTASPVAFVGASCAAIGMCAAVGGLGYPDFPSIGSVLLVRANGAWRSPALPAPEGSSGQPGPSLTGVACLPGTCVLVGSYVSTTGVPILVQVSGTSVKNVDAPLPGTAAAGTARITSVGCSGTYCVASGIFKTAPSGPNRGFLDTYSGGAWTVSTSPLPSGAAASGNAYLSQVSCSASACTIVGSYTDTAGQPQQLVLESGDGTGWTPLEAPLPPSNTTIPSGGLEWISCGSTRCGAIGGYRVNTYGNRSDLVSIEGPAMSSAGPLPGGFGATGPEIGAIGCGAGGSCAAYTSDGGRFDPTLVLTPSGTTWTQQKAPVPGGGVAAGTQLTGAACDDAGACAMAGSYTTSTGLVLGLLEDHP